MNGCNTRKWVVMGKYDNQCKSDDAFAKRIILIQSMYYVEIGSWMMY